MIDGVHNGAMLAFVGILGLGVGAIIGCGCRTPLGRVSIIAAISLAIMLAYKVIAP